MTKRKLGRSLQREMALDLDLDEISELEERTTPRLCPVTGQFTPNPYLDLWEEKTLVSQLQLLAQLGLPSGPKMPEKKERQSC